MPTKQVDINAQIEARFVAPLGDYAERRIVFWHDADGSFEEAFEALSESGIQSSPGCSFAKMGEGSLFSLKKRIARDEAGSDFLVYTREQKNFSAKGLEANWLSDVELYAEHFQADYATLLLDELNASETAAEGITRFKSFFGAAERKKCFLRLMPAAQSKEDVALGVIGAILGSRDLSSSGVIGAYIGLLREGEKPLEKLAKYGADTAFAAFVKSRTGYAGDLCDQTGLMAHISLSALSCSLPQGSLEGLEARMSLPHGQFCLNVMNDWLRDGSLVPGLFRSLRRVEDACNLPQRFSKLGARALAECDVFPCINECILTELMESLAYGSDRSEDAAPIVRRRKELAWYGRVEAYCSALEAAIEVARFFRKHSQGFHLAVPVDVWSAYTGDWYRMDTAYRRYVEASTECLHSPADLPGNLDEALEKLSSWVDRVYAHWFLADANACWVNACSAQWEEQGFANGIARQEHFYDEQVLAGTSGAKKTVVLISDALRYEVAAELAERLERETRGSAELTAMQCTFPSITEFGMAALLPHHGLSYDCASDTVSCDGMPAMNTKEREAVLVRRRPKSRAVQSKDLLLAKRADRKGIVGDFEVAYVYHNKIDATGEDYSTESDVFSACETAIDDLVALVKIAVNDLNSTRVVITADHGFIYTREALDEKDKVGKGDLGAEAARLGRRYAILEGKRIDDSLFVKMNMDAMAGGSYLGLSPRECIRIKKPGPGESYVHGGASLQEMCVPVIQFKNRRSGSAGYVEQSHAEVKLLSTSRKVTSMIFRVELFQTQPVGGKVLPAEYELVMVDSSGNEVSNVLKVHADASKDVERTTRVQFSLKNGPRYTPKLQFFLLCREKEGKAIVWKEEFQIDIAFAPEDDFGF